MQKYLSAVGDIKLQFTLNNIYRWCQSNGLYLKLKICLMITFSLKTKPTQFDYSLENINL